MDRILKHIAREDTVWSGTFIASKNVRFVAGGMVHDERRSGVFCVEHTKVAATSRFVVRFGRKIRRRYNDYEGARRFLYDLRSKADKGKVDPRDYAAGKPLSVRVCLTEWIERREVEAKRNAKRSLKKGSFKSYRPAVLRAIDYFGERSVKDLTYDDIESFFYYILGLGLAEKTAKNNCDTLRAFYNWLLKNRTIKPEEAPVWPSFDADMKKHPVIDLETQELILSKIQENEDPKVWLACSLLARHINVRPGELLQIEEGEIDLRLGLIRIGPEKTKTKSETILYLYDDEIEALSAFPKTFPKMRFFRHTTTVGGVEIGSPMGDKLWNRAWCRAAKKLGIEGVTLYPGTKHSTASAVANSEGLEAAKAMTGHKTNAAFLRYIIESREGGLRVLSARDRALGKATGIDGSLGQQGTHVGHQKETPKNRK
jgi:integrase